MNVIYAPKGRAAEYGELAANLFKRCGHRCVECYVPDMFRMTYAEFNETATLRPGVLEQLEREARQLEVAKDNREIVMSFTTDPYHPGDNSATRKAIEIFMRHGLRFTVLTKGGYPRSTRDFDLMREYADRCRYGASLTFSDPLMGAKYEPGAALPESRIEALWIAKYMGIPTWASIEPVLFTEESLEIIKRAMPFVDEFRIGAVNHVEAIIKRMPSYVPPSRLEMIEFTCKVIDLLEGSGRRLFWKHSMEPYVTAAFDTVDHREVH